MTDETGTQTDDIAQARMRVFFSFVAKKLEKKNGKIERCQYRFTICYCVFCIFLWNLFAFFQQKKRENKKIL